MMPPKPSRLTYTLCVMGSAYGTQQSASALRFARAVIQAGHQLVGVFFYAEGVHNANAQVSPAADEINLVAAWQQLQQQYAIPLYVCVAAAQRRGVVVEVSDSHHCATGFQLSGLATLTELLLSCDRTLQF